MTSVVISHSAAGRELVGVIASQKRKHGETVVLFDRDSADTDQLIRLQTAVAQSDVCQAFLLPGEFATDPWVGIGVGLAYAAGKPTQLLIFGNTTVDKERIPAGFAEVIYLSMWQFTDIAPMGRPHRVAAVA